MRTKIFRIFLALLVVSCGGNKQSQISKLLKQRDELNEKIKTLQSKAADDPDASKTQGIRVAVTELKPSVFDHFIEVQAKVDGDQNVNVFAEGAGGMVKQILVTEGQSVNKGQILATLDDNLLQQNLNSVQSNLDYVTTMFAKQKALWDQKIGSEAQYLDIKSKKESLEKFGCRFKRTNRNVLYQSPGKRNGRRYTY